MYVVFACVCEHLSDRRMFEANLHSRQKRGGVGGGREFGQKTTYTLATQASLKPFYKNTTNILLQPTTTEY